MLKKSKNFVFSWKKTLLFLLICLCITTSFAFADYRLTRGPDIGEIYFIGPTATSEGIYYSTDFGKTAICMDSISAVESICADKTPGVLYYDYYDNLFVSYNYGQYGSWVYRGTGSIYINSGVTEGFIYCDISKHSEDYGLNFISHNCTGFVGNGFTTEIDNQDGVGYVPVHITGINDSLYLFITYDNYDSLFIHGVFNVDENPIGNLSRGTEYGELYNFADSPKRLSYSSDYGETWELHNIMNGGLDYKNMVGGRQEGEVYIYGYYDEDMLTIEHSYIFYSTDYGKTFIVYHPFSKGEEPLVANFSSAVTEGNAPLSVSFCNYAVGEIQNYEWDFDNDGVIDSYDAEPEYTYQDTGYYSVKLTVYNTSESDEFLREHYIHVKTSHAIDEEGEHLNIIVNNIPNPFRSSTVIQYTLPHTVSEAQIAIYNIKGQLVQRISSFPNPSLGTQEIVWDGKNDKGKEVGAGMYFIYMKTGENVHVKKIVKIGL